MDDATTPRDGSVDKLLYDNLAEMIRLIPAEPLLGQQTTKAFSFKKVLERSTLSKPSQGSNSGKLSQGSSFRSTVSENVPPKDEVEQVEEIPMLPLSSSHHQNGDAVPVNEIDELRSKIQELELKLEEKDCQIDGDLHTQDSLLSPVGRNTQQTDVQLDARVERLESQVQQLQLIVQKVQDQLVEKQEMEDSSTKQPGLGQLLLRKRGIVDMLLNDQDGYEEEIPMLPIPSSHGLPTAEVLQLHDKVQQLERKLEEKDCQLQESEKNVQQIHAQLNETIENFKSQMQEKETVIKELQNQLFRRQLEVIHLQGIIKKLERDIKEANDRDLSDV